MNFLFYFLFFAVPAAAAPTAAAVNYRSGEVAKESSAVAAPETAKETAAPLKEEIRFEYRQSRQIKNLLGAIPVQAGGRIKPLDTFAEESVKHIYGKKDSDSLHWVMTWFLLPEEWFQKPFVWIEKAQIKKALLLSEKKSHFSPLELLNNKNFQREIGELDIRRKQNEKLNSYFLEIEKLESRLVLFQAVAGGRFPGWMPDSVQANSDWLSADQLKGPQRAALAELFNVYSKTIHDGNVQNLKTAVDHLKTLTNVSDQKIKMEVHYNSLKPFRISWVFYLISLIIVLFSSLRKYFFIPLGFAFVIHTYGIALRSYIMSRPPVSNMFETLLWVPWAALVMAFVMAWICKKKFPLVVGGIVCFLCLFISDTSSILNDQLEPLEAVLRSNFWLSTHVLIITMSYSAFFLAFIMSDFLAFKFLMGRKPSKNHFWFLQRVLQVGVFLLTLGTLLGAIWADYSWGRFWGWDPKEVWALVSLLGYLALLHAKLRGWIREFGLVIGSICCFFLIIMAWYGVNFILGKGLHSYGFGTGGFSYVLTFVLVHFLFLYLVWRKKTSFEA